MASYWIAYIGDGPDCVEYVKLKNKDDVIDWLMMGFRTDNWTSLHASKQSCQKEVEEGWENATDYCHY